MKKILNWPAIFGLNLALSLHSGQLRSFSLELYLSAEGQNQGCCAVLPEESPKSLFGSTLSEV